MTRFDSILRGTGLRFTAWLPVLLMFSGFVFADEGRRFGSPEEAVQALSAAAGAGDTNALHQIFGPASLELISPDLVQASAERELFVQRVLEKVELLREGDWKASLQVGSEGWPFPIPLVKKENGWIFDTAAGKEEVLNRRIGKNELGAIRVCRSYVDAQREYAGEDRNGDQVLEFAQRFRSSPGARDGLYWPEREGEDPSPFGPLIAQAHREGYRHVTKALAEESSPYHGYFFKILTRQGRHAAGGKYDYVINGRMIGGFALIAWPAEWGNTGVMTFMVNQQGKVFQKNLGPKTSSKAPSVTAYNPDQEWTLAE